MYLKRPSRALPGPAVYQDLQAAKARQKQAKAAKAKEQQAQSAALVALKDDSDAEAEATGSENPAPVKRAKRSEVKCGACGRSSSDFGLESNSQ